MRFWLAPLLSAALAWCSPGAEAPTPEAAEKEAERIGRLVRNLGNEAWPVREQASEELKKIGEAAVPELERALSSTDPEVAWRAEKILRAVRGQGWLGVSLRDLGPEEPEGMKLPPSGALIVEVLPGTPAEKAGLQPGDYLIELSGEKLRCTADVLMRIGRAPPKKRVPLVFIRGEGRQELEVELGRCPPEHSREE